MKCMKCGVSIPSGRVFCETCLTDMAAHPVPQDAPLLLPRREKQQTVKRSRKKARKPEEQVTMLRKIISALLMTVLVLAIALTVSIYALVHLNNQNNGPLPGQNYGTSEPAQ